MRRQLFLESGLETAQAAVAAPRDALGTVPSWNRLALRAARDARAGPASAQVLATLHTCMYNAWAAYDDEARQTVHGMAVRLPRRERDAASKGSAMSHAAWRILAARFPDQRTRFDARMAGLGLDPAAPASQFSPAGIGRTQAAAMLDAGGVDGAGSWVDAALTERWCDLAGYLAGRDRHDDDQDVLLYFALANALADAGRAGACAGASAAEVLRRFTGGDALGGGIATFSEAARREECFGTGDELGREIGALAFDRARRCWQGKL